MHWLKKAVKTSGCFQSPAPADTVSAAELFTEQPNKRPRPTLRTTAAVPANNQHSVTAAAVASTSHHNLECHLACLILTQKKGAEAPFMIWHYLALSALLSAILRLLFRCSDKSEWAEIHHGSRFHQ